VFSLLQKGLNFAVTPRSTPIEDTLAGVEKAALSLPVEIVRQMPGYNLRSRGTARTPPE
jgi:hypothetical protein